MAVIAPTSLSLRVHGPHLLPGGSAQQQILRRLRGVAEAILAQPFAVCQAAPRLWVAGMKLEHRAGRARRAAVLVLLGLELGEASILRQVLVCFGAVGALGGPRV